MRTYSLVSNRPSLSAFPPTVMVIDELVLLLLLLLLLLPMGMPAHAVSSSARITIRSAEGFPFKERKKCITYFSSLLKSRLNSYEARYASRASEVVAFVRVKQNC